MPWLSEILFTPPPDKEWAMGCFGCDFGLINPPPATGIAHVTRADIRVYQYTHGLLEFCACKAGEMYREFLDEQIANRDRGNGSVTRSEHERLTEFVQAQKRERVGT